MCDWKMKENIQMFCLHFYGEKTQQIRAVKKREEATQKYN